MKKLILMLPLLLATGLGRADARSFAIVTDQKSYDNCKKAIEDYASSVRGFDAFVCAADWKTPDQVKDSLVKWYGSRDLAGCVFVGDIPIAMVQGAQHFTSAFKMTETLEDRRDSSVPTDRFYDDFDLKFISAGHDEGTLYHYYTLAPDSPGNITCELFSGRIKPSGTGSARYEMLNAYLTKLVKVKAETNPLDNFVSYTGEGSFSDSMIAWKDETVTLGEEIPDAFKSTDASRFHVFYNAPYAKQQMLDECCREDVDLVLYHHHGTPERQWIQSTPAPDYTDTFIKVGQMRVREYVRRQVRRGKTEEEAKASARETYGVNWGDDAFEPELAKADSLDDAAVGILLEDVHAIESNARMLIFDACYNGDFREDDFIANAYIMGSGKSVVALGNSVNVLQDKNSSPIIGMLTAGYTVGQWHQMTAILESHVIGDPTFAFTSTTSAPDFYNQKASYWKKVLASKTASSDVKGLALYKLHSLRAKGLDKVLYDTYCNSDEYSLRLSCLTLLRHYKSDYFHQAALKALDDPYEYIRRKCTFALGQRGDVNDLDALTDSFLADYNAKRVAFNGGRSAGHFPDSLFMETVASKVNSDDSFIYDKEQFLKDQRKNMIQTIHVRESVEEALAAVGSEKRYRMSMLHSLRNEPFPVLVDSILATVRNQEENMTARLALTEALGWFYYAHNRSEIVASLKDYLNDPACPQELRPEITKTITRLEDYLR